MAVTAVIQCTVLVQEIKRGRPAAGSKGPDGLPCASGSCLGGKWEQRKVRAASSKAGMGLQLSPSAREVESMVGTPWGLEG